MDRTEQELDQEQVDQDGPRRQRTSPRHPRNQEQEQGRQEQGQLEQEQGRQEQDQLEQGQEQLELEQRTKNETGPQPAHTHGPYDRAACSAGTSPRGDRPGADDQILYKSSNGRVDQDTTYDT